MRLRYRLTNRIVLFAVAFFIVVGVFVFYSNSRFRTVYQRGHAEYRQGKYLEAAATLESAYNLRPNDTQLVTLLGWTHLKLRHFAQAQYFFERVRNMGSKDEAETGFAALAVESGNGRVDVTQLQDIHERHPNDSDVQYLLATGYVQHGRNALAIALFKRLLTDPTYAKSSRSMIETLTGVDAPSEPVPDSLPPLQRPAKTQVGYRAAEGSMWRAGANGWEKYYVKGVNLGPGAPGYYPGAPPLDTDTYDRWLQLIGGMNANVVRAYTLLPPAFYHAFWKQASSGSKLILYQQIWVDDPPGKNLYERNFVEQTKAEIRYVIDAIHGHGDIPVRHARGGGLYVHDVAAQVGAILLGREIEASTAITTNQFNPSKTAYTGTFVSVSNANATETWFAEMLDYLVRYENDTYNFQHPVAVVNWPPLDPLYHPTESSITEEIAQRIRRGERLAPLSGPQDDNDAVAIDEAKFKIEAAFQAGLFASYHVYPYYPDFLIQDPRYLAARDSEGPNPMYGYLKELRAHIPHPLLITEYGIPTSMGVSHWHPYGWNHGGHNEADQARILTRLSRTIEASGCAGGIVFEFLDEWYKHNWLTVDFEAPLERANLWLNEIDPEKRYGLVGFRTSRWRLFAGDGDAWNKHVLSNANGELPGLRAAADEAYLYLRLDGVCESCLDHRTYAVAVNTVPAGTGFRNLPFGAAVKNGANFLLLLEGRDSGRLLISDNYYPYRANFEYRTGLTTSLQDGGNFRNFVVQTNRLRFSRDGKISPPMFFDRTPLRYGNGNPEAADFDSLANWFYDAASRAIIVRIPWGLLLVTDPSSRQVFAGFDSKGHTLTATSPGVALSTFVLANGQDRLDKMKVLAASPEPKIFTWAPWDAVAPELYLKKSYYALQKEFR